MNNVSKTVALWLLSICGIACHSICDILPMFWGKDMAIVATDGNMDQGMAFFMMTMAFLMPACGILCLLINEKAKSMKLINFVLSVVMALLNIMHAFMEIPSENAGQYAILPLMVVICCMLTWQSYKVLKNK